MTLTTIEIDTGNNKTLIEDDCMEAVFECPPENLYGASFYARPVTWERLIRSGIIREPKGADKYYRIQGVPVFVQTEDCIGLSFVYCDGK